MRRAWLVVLLAGCTLGPDYKRPSIELPVRDFFPLANHRHGIRGSIGLLLNELMQTPRP